MIVNLYVRGRIYPTEEIPSATLRPEPMSKVRDAIRTIGQERAKAMLPKPFIMWFEDHSTGCQISILAEADDKPRLLAWYSSEWYSSIYHFNDDGKIMGLQPEFQFAQSILDKFFADVFEEAAKAIADRALREVSAQNSEQRKKEDALDHYRKILTN